MIVAGGGPIWRFWEAAAARINHVFENYPGGGSRGVLTYVNLAADGTMRKLGTAVVPGHPDWGIQEPAYWVEVISAGNEKINEFGMWDYRKSTGSDIGRSVTDRDNVTFPLNIPFHGNPRWVNIFDYYTGDLVISMDLGRDLYGWCYANNWDGEDCATLDTDNNGVPDSQETEDTVVGNQGEGEFTDRPDLIKEKAMPTPPPPGYQQPAGMYPGGEQATSPTAEIEKPSGGGAGGIDLTWVIAILVAIVGILLLVFFLKKRGKKPEEKAPEAPKAEGKTCKKCGSPVEKGQKFCPSCGAKG
jgi:hypothetical protein